MKYWYTFAVVAIGLSGSGCGAGPGDQPDTARVQGVVTLDGQPLAGATVAFYPEKGRAASATTDSQGNYTLQYSDSVRGALVGRHTVRITTAEASADAANGGQAERLPARYHDESTLTAEVKSGSNTIPFELTSKP